MNLTDKLGVSGDITQGEDAAKSVLATANADGAALISRIGTAVTDAISEGANTILALLAAQDGWTVKVGPIIIPEIVITLHKPESK